MKTIHRYILRECFWPFLIGAFFFTFVFIVERLPKLVELYAEKGTPFLIVFQLFIYTLPFTAALTIPMGVLFGVLLAFERMSSNSEIIAMRASGVSILSIFKPVLLFGILITLVMFWFTNYVMPETNHRYKNLWREALLSNPSIGLRDRIFTEISDTRGEKRKISMLNTSEDGQHMESVFIYEYNEGMDDIKITYAQAGHWENNEPNSPLVTLVLTNGMTIGLNLSELEKLDHLKFENFTLNIFNETVDYSPTAIRGLREVSAFDIRKQIQEKIEKKQVVTPQYYVEYHKKFSIPFICLIFVLVGMPLGITFKRGGKGMSMGTAVVIIFIYYGLLMGMETFGKRGKIDPSLSMWLPNIILLCCGLYFFYRHIKE